METGEVIYEKVYASPRPPSKISLKHDWTKELGSEVARQPEREVARQAKSSQSTQLNPNPDHDRTVRPVVCPQRGAPRSRFSRDSTNFILKEDTNHDRTERRVVCRDANHERSMLNEVDVDFRIPRLPHSVVKQAETIVFVNSSRRSRTTLTNNLFNEIYNKTKPTTRSVRRTRK